MLTKVEPVLQHATPESQGIASSAILEFVEALENQTHEIHSFILMRHGNIVAEGWWSPYGREYPHMLFSLSKSFTSTAVGLAVSEGHFSVDDPVLSFFPEYAPAEVNEHLAAMRVRHLLSMSTGHAQDTMPYIFEHTPLEWGKGFFEVPVVHPPGTHFLYNTGATYMLSAILQKTTGMKLIDYLTPRLFEPLGIENPAWEETPQGINTGGFGLKIKTEGIASFGQLYLQKGMWEGKQLVPEAWVEEATSSHVSNGDNPESDWAQGYGYQFWLCRHNAYRGDGAFGQYCVVMPEQDAILAINSGLGDMQQPLNFVWDILLPAMKEGSLPDDTAAQDALTSKLSDLSILPVQGKPSSPTVAKVSGRSYKVDSNELNIESLSLNFTGTDCTIQFKSAAGETSITSGYGTWQPGETVLLNEPERTEPYPFVASGAWTSEDTFTMVVRLHDTPFYRTFAYRFAGDNLKVEYRINVSFQPPQTEILVAHAV